MLTPLTSALLRSMTRKDIAEAMNTDNLAPITVTPIVMLISIAALEKYVSMQANMITLATTVRNARAI
jgi:hypothetical protein